MRLELLDAGGAGLIAAGIVMLVIGIIAIIVVETIILAIIKFNSFKRNLRDVFIINIVSLIAGIVLFGAEVARNASNIFIFFMYFVVTYIIETLLLYLLNKNKPVKTILLASLAINIASYLLLYLLL